MIVRGITQISQTEASSAVSNLLPTESSPLAESGAASFESVLGGMLTETSAQMHAAAEQSEAVARGTLDDLHGTMIAVKEAEISLKLVGSVRNKLIEAFQEIWRTNV
jgi:flagellar hook-basal body complex protein FliE